MLYLYSYKWVLSFIFWFETLNSENVLPLFGKAQHVVL